MIVKYNNFEVRNNLNEDPNVDNFFRTDYDIFRNGKFVLMLTHVVVNLKIAQDLMSGDENCARRGILNAINTMKEHIKDLESVL